jgi:hypothetical protein
MKKAKSQKQILTNPWSVHTVNLLSEILSNPGTSVLVKPLQIFGSLLYEVADRAKELNDPKLTALMCKLTLYEQTDPSNENYIGHEALQKIYKEAGFVNETNL